MVVIVPLSGSMTALEAISDMHLTPEGGVAGRLPMLTYLTVCCAFSATGASPVAVIRHF
jgi:hypothetical protein